MSSVLLIGADGQLGTDLLRLAGTRHVVSVSHSELDVRDRDGVEAAIASRRPDVVVNAAAYVDVERCETNPELAFAVNADGARNVAVGAEAAGAQVVYVSTDYVFDGTAGKPYTEDDPPRPINVYGDSKLAGERFVRESSSRLLIVRSSGLYGAAATRAKGNFVRTMLRLGKEKGQATVVDDQELSPTNTVDLARALWWLIDHRAEGTFHATNAGSCTWFEFARAIFELSGLDVAVHPTDSTTLGYRAARPAYSVLDNAKLEHAGFGRMRPWREALAAHLEAVASLT